MPQKPSFIVDPSGNVRDVRGQNCLQEPQPSSQQPGHGSSTPGRGGFSGSTKRTPGGFIIIPIGLIITLVIVVLQKCGGTPQNSYPESDVNQLNSGLYSYDQGDYKNALIDFDMLISSQPKMGEAYNDRGLTYFAMGDTDNAMTDFNKAIELLPNPAIAYSNRGGLYFSLGKHEQALADLDKAIELSPRLAKAFHNRGLTYLDLGNYDQAIADFDQAIQLTPETMFSIQATEQSRATPGNSLLGSGFWTGMINRETYADLPAAYASRAMAYLHKGDYTKAAADLKKATQLGLDTGLAQQVEALLSVSTLEPPPVSTPSVQSGHWEGSATLLGIQGNISFDIGTDGQIHDFKLGLVYPGGSSCQLGSYYVLVQPDGTFSFAFDAPSIENGILTQGKFESSTVVVGSFNGYIQCITSTGEQMGGGQLHGDPWSAQWTSGPAQTPTENAPFGQPVSTATSVDSGAANITTLAIDPRTPSTLYAGTSAGVIKSTDAGGQGHRAAPR